MENLQTEAMAQTASKQKRSKNKWLGKYAEDLAGSFFALMVLLLAVTAYLAFSYLSAGGAEEDLLKIALLLVGAAACLGAGLKFGQAAREYERESSENAVYILSDWSVKTLKSAGVPDDITGCLRKILYDFKNKKLPENFLEVARPFDEKSGGWFFELGRQLGKTRVEEFRDTILKYTRREKPPAAEPEPATE